MKNFLSLLFGYLLLTNMGFRMVLGSGSFHSIETIVASGNAAGDNFGSSVSTAGDVNSDGYDDIIVGAYSKNTYQGAAYVIYGGTVSTLRGLNLHLDTQALDPLTTGFIIIGNAANDVFGRSVSAAGDFDNDGYDDIIVGASGKNSNRGAAYLIYGRQSSAMSNIDLSSTSLIPSSTGFMITGNAAGDYFGYSVSKAGDIDNDGYDDIIVGAYGKNNFQGAVYVIYGGQRSAMSNIVLSSTTLIPTSTGFTITGNAVQDFFGKSVSTAGDINNDGYDDIIVGAPGKNSNQGAAYVIYGRARSTMSNIDLSSTSLIPSSTGFMITGNAVGDNLGVSVSTAGDINNDGYDDIIVGAYYKNNYQGAAYVIYGGPKSSMSNVVLSSTPLDPLTTGFMITGNAANDLFGFSVRAAGDVNNDGYDDIIIGAYGKNSNQGAAYVIYGGKKSAMTNIVLSSTTLYPLSTGFMITGEAIGDSFGYSVSGAGDLNKDGNDDIIIGASVKNSIQGASYLYLNQCPENCETCDTFDTCKTCSEGYVLGVLQCDPCPTNCNTCSSASSCTDCVSPYLLYHGQCDYQICPSRTLALVDQCQDCLDGCSVCLTTSTCETCLDGYTLTKQKLCQLKVTDIKIEEKDGEKIVAGVFEGTSLADASLNSGSSLPFNFGLVAKIIRNFKYMALPVSRELQETFVSWKVASGFMSAPDSWSEKYSSKTIPLVFSRYKLQSAFLINFWKPLSMALVGIVVFAIFKAIEVSTGQGDQKSTLFKISRQIHVAASNFALTQFYGNLDDVLFYFVIEMRSTEFETGFRVCSSLFAIIFLVVGGIIIGVHLKLVAKYQNLKEKENLKQLKSFETKCENINLIFKDFKDSNTLVQSFLIINVVRSVISSLIFAVLFESPMIQISFLFVPNILMLVYLWNKKSYRELKNTGGQIFCEVILFIANCCVFLLALFDHADSYPITAIENIGKCIIVLNYILLIGCAILLLFNLGKAIYQAYLDKKNGPKVFQAPLPTDSPILAPPKLKSSVPVLDQSDHNLSTNGGFINESQNNLNHSESYANNDSLKIPSYYIPASPDRHSSNMRKISPNYSTQNRPRNESFIENFEVPSSNNVLQGGQVAGNFEEETRNTVQPRSRLLRNREITKARIAQFSSSPERGIQDPSFY